MTTAFIGPRPAAQGSALTTARARMAAVGAQTFTEIYVLADCGEPKFPHWRVVVGFLLLAQIVILLAQQPDLQLRLRPGRGGRTSRIADTKTGSANGIRLHRITSIRELAR